VPLDRVTAVRVEVLSDDSLPQRGPGRQDNGNLHLSEVRVKVAPTGKPEQAVSSKLKSAAGGRPWPPTSPASAA
jgi:hypothetical protein